MNQSIVVPCYNEAANLPSLIQRFEAIREPGSDWELILVNNGSTDDSRAVLEQELRDPSRAFIRIVTVPSPNQGYGHGIMAGLRAAKGAFLAWTHADGQTDPGDVLRAFAALQSAPNPQRLLVKGRRRERPLRDTAFTFGMQFAAAILLGTHLPDINGQPKAFPRALLDLAVAPPIDLSLDLYFQWIAKANGFDICPIDVRFSTRAHGESKWAFSWRSKWRNVLRTLKFMAALRLRRPYAVAFTEPR